VEVEALLGALSFEISKRGLVSSCHGGGIGGEAALVSTEKEKRKGATREAGKDLQKY